MSSKYYAVRITWREEEGHRVSYMNSSNRLNGRMFFNPDEAEAAGLKFYTSYRATADIEDIVNMAVVEVKEKTVTHITV